MLLVFLVSVSAVVGLCIASSTLLRQPQLIQFCIDHIGAGDVPFSLTEVCSAEDEWDLVG